MEMEKSVCFEDTGFSDELDARYERKRSVKDDVEGSGPKWGEPGYCLLKWGRLGEEMTWGKSQEFSFEKIKFYDY